MGWAVRGGQQCSSVNEGLKRVSGCCKMGTQLEKTKEKKAPRVVVEQEMNMSSQRDPRMYSVMSFQCR